jgi:hypothetical protein
MPEERIDDMMPHIFLLGLNHLIELISNYLEVVRCTMQRGDIPNKGSCA